MNDQQRAAMTMALEALENLDERELLDGGLICVDAELTALREALAQQKCRKVPSEHGGFSCDCVNGRCVAQPQESDIEHYRAIKKRNAEVVALETAQPQGFAQRITAKFKSKNTPPSVEAMRIDTLEKAAQVCDDLSTLWYDEGGSARDCAAAIRGLK